MTESLEEFAEKNKFLAGVMESNILGITRGVSGPPLFFGVPGHSSTAKRETVPTNGAARVTAIGKVGVRVAN